MKKTAAFLLLVAFIAALPLAHAQSERWPNKPVRVVVPTTPGGGLDTAARLLSARMSEEFGQQFFVDNRPGAAGNIASTFAARATPDGYTLILVSSNFAAAPALFKLTFDPIKDIAPISRISAGPYVLVVHPSVKASNLKEFIDLARANPGTLNYGSSGSGSGIHLVGEHFRRVTGTDLVHVPYKSQAPAIVGLLGGEVQLMFAAAVVAPHIRAGRLRGLGVTTEQRWPGLPELPPIGEALSGYAADWWYGMWAPAGTPAEIISRLNQAVGRALQHPEVRDRLRADGAEPAHTTPDEYARIIARDIGIWSKVIRDGNIRVE
jgi:tripartite-type tricarboxylate transporter receptor subunit TctC